MVPRMPSGHSRQMSTEDGKASSYLPPAKNKNLIRVREEYQDKPRSTSSELISSLRSAPAERACGREALHSALLVHLRWPMSRSTEGAGRATSIGAFNQSARQRLQVQPLGNPSGLHHLMGEEELDRRRRRHARKRRELLLSCSKAACTRR